MTQAEDVTIADEIRNVHHGLVEDPSKIHNTSKLVLALDNIGFLNLDTMRHLIQQGFAKTMGAEDSRFNELSSEERVDMFDQSIDLIKLSLHMEEPLPPNEWDKIKEKARESAERIAHNRPILEILDRMYDCDPSHLAENWLIMGRNYFGSDAYAENSPGDRSEQFEVFIAIWELMIFMPSEEWIHLSMETLSPEDISEDDL
ncbi:MAG: hypothetical protein MK081_13820 [Flavobacteriales bacterium]|nr:hypothetical protein [Flavobacteriales bacterium]